MTADQYLNSILTREMVYTAPQSPIRNCIRCVQPQLQAWSNGHLLSVTPSESFAKGIANNSGTDIDLFISVTESAVEILKRVYDRLFYWMTEAGGSPRRQDISIGITVDGYSVDLVPAKRRNALSFNHGLYRRRADTWTKTNVFTHINLVANCGLTSEIRIPAH